MEIYQNFMITVCVVPDKNSKEPWPEENTIEYYQNIGIRTKEENIKNIIEDVIKDRRVVWEESDFEVIDDDEIKADLVEDNLHIQDDAIWHKSGCGFFSDW